MLNVNIRSRGKVLEIFGKNAELTHNVLNDLYRQLKKGFSVGFEEVDASIRMNNKINNEIDKSKLSDLVYKLLFLVFIVIGAAANMDAVWGFSDAMILALIFPNMIGLFFLFPKVKEELSKYLKAIKDR